MFDRCEVEDVMETEDDSRERGLCFKSRIRQRGMAMDDFLSDYTVREHFRESAALDQQLTRWGWFRRYEHRPRKSGWRFRMGEALICLGCRLKNRGRVQPVETAGRP